MTQGAYATDSLKYSGCCSNNRSQMLLSTNLEPTCFFLGRLIMLLTNAKSQGSKINCDWTICAD